MKKDYWNIIIAALILFNLFTLSKLNSLERTLDNNIKNLDREQKTLDVKLMIYTQILMKSLKNKQVYLTAMK